MRLARGLSIPPAQVSHSPAPAATGPSPPCSDHAARATLGSPPGAKGARLSDPEGQGQRAPPAVAGGCGPGAEPGLRGRPAAAAPMGRRADRCRERQRRGGRRPKGISQRRGQGERRRLPSRPLPITLFVGFSSPPPTPTGFQAGAAQRKPISGRQQPPAPAKQPPGRDGERPGLGIRDKVGSQLVEIILLSSLALRFRSASWPRPSPHFGLQPPATCGIVGDVVPEDGRGGTCF